MPVHKRIKRKTQPLSSGNIRTPRSLAWYIVVPTVFVLTLTAPWQRTVQNFFAPYLMLSNSAGNAVADQTIKMRSRTELANEVMRLNLENTRLIGEVNKLRNMEEENRYLRSQLELKSPPGYDYISCSVLLRDPWMWNSGFTIDRGSNDGFEPGLAVLAPAPDHQNRCILVGIIESVSKRTSRVITVVNPEFKLSAWMEESETVGFLNAGSFDPTSGGTASIGFLPANKTFAINELIYTTGFEANIPRGLWLGKLESIEDSAQPYGNRLYRRGVMRPAGNFESLRTVIVARLKNSK